VQETFAKALAASGPVPVGTNLNAWLRRIMINTSISGYRTSRAGPQFVTGDARQHEAMPAPGLVQDPRLRRAARRRPPRGTLTSAGEKGRRGIGPISSKQKAPGNAGASATRG
jgi:DNA-directed RNA polymerase specialized sigma24 family protein